MRACFLGTNVCTLGFGVAVVQTAKTEEPEQPPPPRLAPVPADPATAYPWPNRMVQDLKRQDPHYS